jgi:hypothetical protein
MYIEGGGGERRREGVYQGGSWKGEMYQEFNYYSCSKDIGHLVVVILQLWGGPGAIGSEALWMLLWLLLLWLLLLWLLLL